VRLIALVALAACQASSPLDAVAGGSARAAACYEGTSPAEVARALAARLRADGWDGVRAVGDVGERTHVVARRGRTWYSARIAPDACGTRVTSGIVGGTGVEANEVGPGGPGPVRL